VFVIDDDAAMRNALNSPIRSVGLQVDLFGSTQEFQKRPSADAPSCRFSMSGCREEAGSISSDNWPRPTLRIPIIFIR
jgi:FixJ family two-component response regulator